MMLLTTVLLVMGASSAFSTPWGTATLDYSAVNEYIKEHYGISDYFGSPQHRPEDIYNARNGVLDSARQLRPATLNECGFELFDAPTKVSDFSSLRQVRDVYLPELRSILCNVFNCQEEDVVFWHPILRGQDLTMATRTDARTHTGPVAGMVHLDTDVGAYELDGTINLVDKNRIDEPTYQKDVIADKLHRGQRFVLLNIWRNIGDEPIQRYQAPLGIYMQCHERDFYRSSNPMDRSRWYTFARMRPDELLVFKQYDRRIDQPSDLFHCALNMSDGDSRAEPQKPRRSFDLKALVILKEKVPPDLDRVPAAVKPRLTWKESEEFCLEQGRARQNQKTS